MKRTIAVLAGELGLARTRDFGRKLLVGAFVPLVAVFSAGPANADIDDDFYDLLKQYGISIDKDAAVDLAETACESPIAGIEYSNVLDKMQRRYPEYSINTIANVMTQGLLGYCPERLP